MLKIKRDINQEDWEICNLHFEKSEYFSLIWSCESRQRDTTFSEWKFKWSNLGVYIGIYIGI